jgi:hypothetical protein
VVGEGERRTIRKMSSRSDTADCNVIAPVKPATMSALPPKADRDRHGCDVRFVPKADIERLICRLTSEIGRDHFRCARRTVTKDIVSPHRAANSLQRKLADRFDRYCFIYGQ